MSVAIYPDVLYLKVKPGRKLVLAVLADHANKKGACWPSQARLAHRASISRRKLRDHLRGLEKDEWLQTYIGQGPGGVNVYQLNVSKISEAASIEKERIAKEKEQHWLNLSETQSEGPDFEDTPPDFEDISSDIQNITPDFENTSPGPVGPTEPSENRNKSSLETKEESSWQLIQKKPPKSVLTDGAKASIKDRVRGWAELENEDSNFSDPQSISLLKALSDACKALPQSELLIELWSWDFLDSARKDEWKNRIELQYADAEAPLTV